MTVRHRGVSFELDLADGERLYPACSSIWRGLRLKLVTRGRLLGPQATAQEAAGAALQLISSAEEPRAALPPGLRAQMDEWREGVRELLGGLWAALPPRGHLLRSTSSWLWGLCRGVFRFVITMVAPPARPEPREGPR